MVGRSCAIFSLLDPSFSGVILVMSGDVVNPIFLITMMIFVNGLPRDLCDGLYFITTGLN